MVERLAGEGGKPVRATFLPYARHQMTEEDRTRVLNALDSEWLTTGPLVEEFEQALAAYVGVSHAVAVSSGTAALHLAAEALGMGPGEELVTSPFTFAATSNAALFCGGRPVFADIDPATLNLDPEKLEEAVAHGARLIVPVHFAGQPCRMEEINRIAEDAGAFVLEDAAHAIGASYGGVSAGALGHAAVFSFHAAKHITTLEGGAVVTSDGDLAAAVRRLRNHGIEGGARSRVESVTWSYDIDEVGYNYRLSDVACALGLSQLARLDLVLDARRRLARRYLEGLRDIRGVSAPRVDPDVEHAWHLFTILLDPAFDRRWVFEAMLAENIGVNVHYMPVHLFALYRRQFGFSEGDFPVAEATYERILTLPLFSSMTEDDVTDVLTALDKVLSQEPARLSRAASVRA